MTGPDPADRQSPDPRLVFAKSRQGQDEIARRSNRLTGSERRVLILIDGRRRLVDLAAYVRGGEIGPVIDKLMSFGLVSLSGVAEQPPPNEPPDDPGRRRARLARVQSMLAGLFEAELGAAGRPLDEALAQCPAIERAGLVVRANIDVVGARLGKARAERLIALSRQAFDPDAA